ncbi:MAG TPA: DUF2442 domain-containing protein [Victivallales bacterium]|nr:DUF2442 domain-containing protein [Victivallales bacterium]
MLGINTIDKPKVTSITPSSITVTLKGEEYYLPFSRYPWFEYCSIRELTDVIFDGIGLCWEQADIDLELDLIGDEEKEVNVISLKTWLDNRKKAYSKKTGALGGRSRSFKKRKASKLNGRLGGRPKKQEKAKV